MLLKFLNASSLSLDNEIAYTEGRYVYKFKTIADFEDYFICSFRAIIASYLHSSGTVIKEFLSSFIFEVHKDENKYILNEIEFRH